MKTNLLLLAISILTLTAPLLAQSGQGRNFSRREAYLLEIGKQDQAAANNEVVLRETVRKTGAPWLRMYVGKYNLGQNSYLLLTSVQDKGQQRFDARTLPQWNNSTAYFNGEAVEVELHIAPGEAGVFVRFTDLTVGEVSQRKFTPQNLCGSDDRVATTDPRIGRFNNPNAAGNTSGAFCTVWLVSNGALLTAGHCVDGDADGVNDNRFTTGVVEFNVPASQNNGTTQFASPNDQYPINFGSVVRRYDGTTNLGRDWALFGCNANANTGLTPHQAQGDFFRMTNDAPAAGATIRITGHGTDTGAQNRTLQTSTGPYSGESNMNNTDFWHRYRVDTQAGNSGGPIIWEATGLAIGIHTTGGCSSSSNSANNGTSFEVDALEDALRNFSGPNAVHVDNGHPAGTRDGNIFRPYASVTAGVNGVSTGGTVSIVAGTYSDRLTLSRPMTLTAPAGAVIIGR